MFKTSFVCFILNNSKNINFILQISNRTTFIIHLIIFLIYVIFLYKKFRFGSKAILVFFQNLTASIILKYIIVTTPHTNTNIDNHLDILHVQKKKKRPWKNNISILSLNKIPKQMLTDKLNYFPNELFNTVVVCKIYHAS